MSIHLHPRHGPHEPSPSSPHRSPGSVRRTSSLDLSRPDGLDGRLVVHGRARDLWTSADGGTEVVARAGCAAEIDVGAGRALRSLHTSSSDDRDRDLDGLCGRAVAGGFRTALASALPDDRRERSLRYFLLDDLPTATLVSGYALGHGGIRPLRVGDGVERPMTPDLCAGWVPDGSIMTEILDTGRSPVATGPVATDLLADDPSAWHRMDALPAHGVRRQRLLDVAVRDVISISAMFRDSHMAPDGTLTVIHEYVVRAIADVDTGTILGITAQPRVLPWQECPRAAASATRLTGTRYHDLRDRIAVDLTGASTCTHLNDLLRSLEDTTALAALAGERRTERAKGLGRAS